MRFFAAPDLAELAGFRECRRCRPREGTPVPQAVTQVRKAAQFIALHVDETITLAALASRVGASPFHLQRTFSRLLGISPRGYQDALRAQRFRRDLRAGKELTGAIYDAGYGSSSRVYERHPVGTGMTPAQYRRGAVGARVSFTIVDTSLGRMLVAGTRRGLCSVKLGDDDERLESELRGEYPSATISREPEACAAWVAKIVSHLDSNAPVPELPLDVRATAFQWKVWRYLQSIPYGQTRSYSDVAKAIGAPRAVRAVARACATNHVCVVIPCHRVVQKDGGLGGYRWGTARKRQLLQKESQ